MRFSLVIPLTALVLLHGSAGAEPNALHVTLVTEAGPAYIVQNDGDYGADGTKFGAEQTGQQNNLIIARRTSLELAYGNHRAVLLYAPFEVTTEFTLANDLQFRDTNFAAGSVLSHRYLFDGYRASYLYRLIHRGPITLEVGASAQIRNAEVAFRTIDGTRRDSENDIGLVGAAKLRLWIQPKSTRWWAAFEADGFSTFGLVSGVKGGIYDLQLMLGHPIVPGFDLVFGARLLGGGARVDSQEIYNWANFVAVTAGVRLGLDTLLGD